MSFKPGDVVLLTVDEMGYVHKFEGVVKMMEKGLHVLLKGYELQPIELKSILESKTGALRLIRRGRNLPDWW